MRFLVLVIATACGSSRAERPPQVVGNVAHEVAPDAPRRRCVENCLPMADYVDTNGKRYTHDSLADHVVVVNFWATWARPSQKEIPQLAKIAERYKAKGVILLGIVTDSIDDAGLAEYAALYNINYPIVRIDDDLLAAYASPSAIPTTFVFDRAGTQVTHHVGPLDDAALAAILDPLVGQ